ncbi:MAG: isochorismatase family protein [Rhizomicrobium sp.]
MTIAFYENRARHPLSTTTLVLVDVCRSSVMAQDDVAAMAIHPVLERCRTALEAARRAGVPVIFVHDQHSDTMRLQDGQSRWLTGFAPRRYESVVASKGLSCYASPYLSEILDGAGRAILLAGLLGLEAASATAKDAARHGHRLTVLSDAVGFDSGALIRDSHATEGAGPKHGGLDRMCHLPVHAISTKDWLTQLTPLSPPPRAAKWPLGAPLRRHSRILG